jgi:hypothetical protein
MDSLLAQAQQLVQDVVHWFQTVVPDGFGILLIPLGVFAILSLWAARHD